MNEMDIENIDPNNIIRISLNCDEKWFLNTWTSYINRIQAMAPPAGPPFWGPFFKGTYLPQNRMHVPHLESER